MSILRDHNKEDNPLFVLDEFLLPKDLFPVVVCGFQLC